MRNGKHENLWGYAKRLRFVESEIKRAFPNSAVDSLRVLDVGCGNGSELALPLAGLGFQVTGIDPDSASINHANELAAGLSNVVFICGRLEELETSSYNAVVISEVLEHLEDPRTLLLACIKHLSEHGVIIVTVPNGYGEFEIDSWVFRKLRLQRLIDAMARSGNMAVGSTDNHASGHLQFFTRRRLRQLFGECSLSVVSEGTSSFLSGPFVGHTLARSEAFIGWNARVTDTLPSAMASGWYFALRRNQR